MNDALTCQFSKGHCRLIPKLSPAFFGKFQRQCVNVIDTTWGRIYFFTCENFGRKFQTAMIFNSLKISSWASDKRLKKVWCVPVATWLAMLAYRCSKVSSFTLVICFVYKVTPYFTSTVLWLLISGVLICLIHRVALLSHLPVAQQFGKPPTGAFCNCRIWYRIEDAKTQKIKPSQNFFYDRRKFRRPCLDCHNMIVTI